MALAQRRRYAPRPLFQLCLSAYDSMRATLSDNRPYDAPIHMLDDDSLINVFYFCRPVALDHEGIGLDGPSKENFKLERDLERWWYKVAQVFQRWRYLMLASPSYLKLFLVCTNGTPLADMLAHLPPLPLIINYVVGYRLGYRNRRRLTAKDEEAILLALQHRDRVRRIHLRIPIAKLQRVVVAMGDHFPILEYVYIAPYGKHERLMLPRTFQAPRLRHLILQGFAYPIGSLLLATPAGLVTLSLENILPSTYFHPSDLLPWLALMPQLETLGISFRSPVLDRDIGRRLLRSPTLTPLTLPNLRWFEFQGVSAYLEALLARLIAPLLQRLKISFFFQLNYTVPHLLQFMSTAENLKFSSARVIFKSEAVVVTALPRKGDWIYDASKLVVRCELPGLSSRVNSTARFFNALHQVFSPVEHLTLDHDGLFSLGGVIATQWRELLRLFPNVKNLAVENGLELFGKLSRSLLMDDIEPPLELFPELNELRIFGGGDTGDKFKPFINARQVSGHPIRLVVPDSERSTDDPIHAHASTHIHHDYDHLRR